MKIKSAVMKILIVIIAFMVIGCSTPQQNSVPITEEQNKTFNVMAPLHVKVFNDPTILEQADWELFRQQLKEASEMGVAAVSVDVWWGDVEGKGDNSFEWQYYQDIFSEIISYDLDIIPILSFHQCGGNVGDDYTSLLPEWIWTKLLNENEAISSIEDLKYVSDAMNNDGSRPYSNEYVALWADEWVMPQYREFMEAFRSTFADYRPNMQEINVSCGPAGELRYPSYNSHDNWSYPQSGRLQCYSNLALSDYRKFLNDKYPDAEGEEIKATIFPEDAETFFSSGAYYQTKEGQDFIEWYNQSLIDHGIRMMTTALSVFQDDLSSNLQLGLKVPGIHWQMVHPTTPRITEIKSGLINSKQLSGSGGYHEMLSKLFEPFSNDLVNLHFTCLEMGNDYSGTGDSDHYSRAQDLVFQVDSASRALELRVKGENALAGNLYNDKGWDQITHALDKGAYEGITILRMGDVTTDNPIGKKRYGDLIKSYNE